MRGISDALNERRAAEAELRRLDDPEAKAQRDTDLAEARKEPTPPKATRRRLPRRRGNWTSP